MMGDTPEYLLKQKTSLLLGQDEVELWDSHIKSQEIKCERLEKARCVL